VCDLETSRVGAPYVYDISILRVNTTQTDLIHEAPKSYLPFILHSSPICEKK